MRIDRFWPTKMSWVTPAWIVGSIFSSTACIISNKWVMDIYHFGCPTFMTCYHFFLTWFVLEVMCQMGLFERAKHIPQWERWSMGGFGVGAVVFMNFNLKLNSVGFYQLSKLCCIPYMIGYNFFMLGKSTSFRVIVSLILLLFGIGLFSINDVQLNLPGSIIAMIGISCVSVFQIKTGSKQTEYNVDGSPLQHATSFQQFALAAMASIVLETTGDNSITKQKLTMSQFMLLLATGVFAVSVNICSFGLIGRTSAVTYQVVGHMKTILIFIFGLIMFPADSKETPQMKRKKIFGLCISMMGVILYTIFQIQEKAQSQKKEEKEFTMEQSIDEPIELEKQSESVK